MFILYIIYYILYIVPFNIVLYLNWHTAKCKKCNNTKWHTAWTSPLYVEMSMMVLLVTITSTVTKLVSFIFVPNYLMSVTALKT